jgi:ABC-2 type transport system ATP-binding protein
MNNRHGATVEVSRLRKTFGTTAALQGVDLTVPAGTVFGLLGPNGAGKTTIVRVLATLLRPDSGSARIAGIDVVREADKVRGLIGLAGQHAAVDEKITGRENLVMFGRLYHLPEATAHRRADELLAQFDLMEARNRIVKHYSGGMRRRLDIAASLIIAPRLLFLDEPTTGLDPRSRNEVWQSVRDLVAAGTTVLLTTQYLDEADQLADEIAVIDSGRVIASGTPASLKSLIGGDRLEVVTTSAQLSAAADALAAVCSAAIEISALNRKISAPTSSGAADLIAVVQEFGRRGIAVEDLTLRRPTLDDVFLHLTRHEQSEESVPELIGVA